jgi:hypothetical protein
MIIYAAQPYLPLISTVTTIITEIFNIYENVQYNKNICNSLMDRVAAAEAAIKTLERRKKNYEKISVISITIKPS